MAKNYDTEIKKEYVQKIVDKYSDMILKAERYIFANPETGFKEFKTSKYMEDAENEK